MPTSRTHSRPSRVGLLGMLLGVLLLAPIATIAQQTPQPSPNEVEKAEALRQDMRQMVSLARDRVFPALVNIEVITVQYWGGKERKGQSIGSGTIIDAEGHVLTNFHVAEDGKKYKCTLADKQEISAELVGDDPLTDLAVLKLNLNELKDQSKSLPHAAFGDSDEIEIGDTVMAMGSPWALSRSVTRGSVSNTERILAGNDEEAGEMYFDQDQRTGIFNRWIQHDAAINPGNSGGPLVNLKGEVVGVNARGSSGGLGFAIPANIAKVVAQKLIEQGEVPRSWCGFSLKSIKKTGHKRGVLVNSIVTDSPADKAGIKAGDIILAFDDKPVTVLYPEQIPPLLNDLSEREIGSTIEVALLRDGKTQTIELVTEKLKRDRGEEAAFRAWGISGKEITDRMARMRRLDSTDGVLVSGVRSGSPAQLAEPAISYGDVIRSIDGVTIDNLAQFADFYEEVMGRDELPEYLLVEFDRYGKNNITLLKPKPDKDIDPPREVAKAWIGVATQPVLKKLAKQLGRPDVLGYRITRVYPGTKAAECGLEVGDIIVGLNGDKLRPRGMQDVGLFQRQVRRLEIDESAQLKVLRDDQEQEIAVMLERTRLTPEEARRDRNRDFELTVRELTFFDRDSYRWDDDVRGVLVESADNAGWADLGGLHPGDLIQRINDTEIRGINSYRKVMEEIVEEQPERVVFVVLRGVSTHFQYVEPEWKPELDKDESED